MSKKGAQKSGTPKQGMNPAKIAPCSNPARRRGMLPAVLARLAAAMTESEIRTHPSGLPRSVVNQRKQALTKNIAEFGGTIGTI